MGASWDAHAYGTMRGGLLRAYSTGLGALNRALDAALVMLGGMLAYWLRFGVGSIGLSTDYDLVALVAALLVAMLFPAFGVYGSWRARGLRAPVMQALAGWAVRRRSTSEAPAVCRAIQGTNSWLYAKTQSAHRARPALHRALVAAIRPAHHRADPGARLRGPERLLMPLVRMKWPDGWTVRPR